MQPQCHHHLSEETDDDGKRKSDKLRIPQLVSTSAHCKGKHQRVLQVPYTFLWKGSVAISVSNRSESNNFDPVHSDFYGHEQNHVTLDKKKNHKPKTAL